MKNSSLFQKYVKDFPVLQHRYMNTYEVCSGDFLFLISAVDGGAWFISLSYHFDVWVRRLRLGRPQRRSRRGKKRKFSCPD
jgi:hypothetical protein